MALTYVARTYVARTGMGPAEVNRRLKNATVEHLQTTRNVSRNLIEKALHMRALGYYSEVKSALLTRTIYEVDRSKKGLSAANRVLDQSQERLSQQVEQRTQALRESEHRYCALAENQAAMVTSFLPDTTRTFVNSTYAKFWGRSRESLIGERWIGVFSESKRAAILTRLACCTRDHPVTEMEHELSLPDGRLCWLHWRFIASFNAVGEITHYQGIAVDITERKALEQELETHRNHMEALVEERTRELASANVRLQELDQLKSLFIASMSHELRTPLNSIIGFAGILLQGLDGELNTLQADHMGRVQRAARHLLNLITDVIDLSKIGTGQMQAVPAEFLLEDVVTEAVDSLREAITNKGLVLKQEIPPLTLFSDRRRLLQCVLNYLSNAVKFTDAGTIAIIAGVQDGSLVLEVRDSGIGIREQDWEKLFTQFTRIDSSRVRSTSGTGLGLYLTKKLAGEVLQGQVSFDSTYGQGSTFRLCVPLNIGPVEAGARP